MAENGEDVVIARAGKPVVRLTRLEPVKRPIVFGLMKGKIHVSDDFDDPLPPEVLAEFEDGLREAAAGYARPALADGRGSPA